MADVVIPVQRGRGLHLYGRIKAPDGTYYNLTGKTFTTFEVIPPMLASVVSVTVSDGPAGQVLLEGPWSDLWPNGVGETVSFYVIPSDPDLPFPKIILRVE